MLPVAPGVQDFLRDRGIAIEPATVIRQAQVTALADGNSAFAAAAALLDARTVSCLPSCMPSPLHHTPLCMRLLGHEATCSLLLA